MLARGMEGLPSILRLLVAWVVALETVTGGVAVGVSTQGRPDRVDLRGVLVAQAREAGVSFVLVSSRTGPSPVWSAALAVDSNVPFPALTAAMGLGVEQGGGLVWLDPIAARAGELGGVARTHLARWSSSQVPAALKAAKLVGVAQTSLGQALVASLSDEQRERLARPWAPGAIATAYDQFLQLGAAEAINMGGFIDGSMMSDFQRRLCAALAFASDMGGLPLWWLASCSEIGFGDFAPAWAERPEWSPEVMVRTYAYPARSVSLRSRGGSIRVVGVPLVLPARTLRGDELSALVQWAKANLPPRATFVPVPSFTCNRHTDGPTRSLTDLVDLEEANREVRIPEDLPVATIGDLLAYFKPYGYAFVLPPAVSRERPMELADPERTDGALTFLTALSSAIWNRPDRLWQRDGNTFTLVYAKWSDRECAEDPRAWLDAGLLSKPVSLVSLDTELSDFVAELRDQTGAPLASSAAFEDCGVQIVTNLRKVPLGDILAGLGAHLGTGWERGNAGEIILAHPDFLQPERATWMQVGVPVRPEEWAQYQQDVAGVALSLLMEALPADLTGAATVGVAQMPEVCKRLMVAACQAASGVTNLDGKDLFLVPAGQDEAGRWWAGLKAGERIYTVRAVTPPTIPPNPLPRDFLVGYVAGKQRVRTGPR